MGLFLEQEAAVSLNTMFSSRGYCCSIGHDGSCSRHGCRLATSGRVLHCSLHSTSGQPVESCCWSARCKGVLQVLLFRWGWALLFLSSLKRHCFEHQSWIVICGEGGEIKEKSCFVHSILVCSYIHKFYR